MTFFVNFAISNASLFLYNFTETPSSEKKKKKKKKKIKEEAADSS